MILDVATFFAGAMVSWLITHAYYKKSLRQQEEASQHQTRRLTEELDRIVTQGQQAGTGASQALLNQRRIEESIAEYRRAGTPVRVIDSYTDLSREQKAELLDTVLLRIKGRRARQNKYRQP